jgi:hypothetical protein
MKMGSLGRRHDTPFLFGCAGPRWRLDLNPGPRGSRFTECQRVTLRQGGAGTARALHESPLVYAAARALAAASPGPPPSPPHTHTPRRRSAGALKVPY